MKVMETHNMNPQVPSNERNRYGDLILSILDKAIIDKESESTLHLNFTPECYIAGYQAVSCDETVMIQVFKEGDQFLHKLLSYDKVRHTLQSGDVVVTTNKQRTQMGTEIARTMVSLVNQDIVDHPTSNLQNQLQQLLPDFLAMNLWKLCFSKNSKVEVEVVVVAHKLLVAFFDELASQHISAAAEKLLQDGIFEGLFKFINDHTDFEINSYAGTFFLVSRIIKSKKVESYIHETEVLQMVLSRMLTRDSFIKSYIRRGKIMLGQQLTSAAEALFEIANCSPKISQELEKYLTSSQGTFLRLQKAFSEIIQTYIKTGQIPSICDESSPLIKNWSYPSIVHDELMNEVRLFEEYSQGFLRFFQMFIYTDSSNLSSTMVEKGFAKQLIESFTSMSTPNWTYIADRASIFSELFKHFIQHAGMPAGPPSSFLKNTGIPAFTEALQNLQKSLEGPSDFEVEMSIRFMLKSTPSSPVDVDDLKPESGITMNQVSIELLQSLANIILISSVCTDPNLINQLGRIPSKTLIIEQEFLQLFDSLVRDICPRLFKVQVPAYIQTIRKLLEKKQPDEVSKFTSETILIKSIRSQSIIDKLFEVFSSLLFLNFGTNSKLQSEFYAKIGVLRVDSLADEQSCPIIVKLAYRLQYLDTIREFVSNRVHMSHNVTSLCALYEGGLIPTAEKALKELANLIGLGYAYLSAHVESSKPLKVDEVILLEQLQIHLPSVYIESCYSLHNKLIEAGEDYYKLGVKQNKNEGMKKCRYIRIKLYESIRNSTTIMLENLADQHSELAQTVETRLVPEFVESRMSWVSELSDNLGKFTKSHQDLVAQLLKLAGNPVTRDPFKENSNPWDPLNHFADGEDIDPLRFMGAGHVRGLFGGIPPARNREPRRAHIPAAVMTGLTEMGFTEERIQAAARHCRNPGNLNELTEWILLHPEPDPPTGAQAQPELPIPPVTMMVDERAKVEECPGIELSQMKTEMTEGYKNVCQTLLRYFLYLPKRVEFAALLSSYSFQQQDQSAGLKSSRKTTLAMHGLLIDFLILLKSQFTKLKSKQDLETFSIELPKEFVRVKTVR